MFKEQDLSNAINAYLSKHFKEYDHDHGGDINLPAPDELPPPKYGNRPAREEAEPTRPRHQGPPDTPPQGRMDKSFAPFPKGKDPRKGQGHDADTWEELKQSVRTAGEAIGIVKPKPIKKSMDLEEPSRSWSYQG